jgi:hypothetical protein
MKKIFLLIIVGYLVLVAGIFYFYFGAGLLSPYKEFNWRGLETRIPADFKVRSYSSYGWDVYYLKKMAMRIKIAVKDQSIDVSRLSENHKKIKFRYSPSEDTTYFLAMVRKEFEMVFAQNIDQHTLYIQIFSPSPYSSRKVMAQLTGNCRFLGREILLPDVKIPISAYLTDFIFFGGMLLPLFILIVIFRISGRKPAEKYFHGDPIRYEEANVFVLRKRRFSRQSTYAYLALTSTRFMGFMFKRPMFILNLDTDRSKIKFEENEITIQLEKETISIKPKNMNRWKSYLMG